MANIMTSCQGRERREGIVQHELTWFGALPVQQQLLQDITSTNSRHATSAAACGCDAARFCALVLDAQDPLLLSCF